MTTVLVVDDDPQIVRALRITLTAHGYRVLTAADGASALRAADDHPDMVVLDLGLPDLDGLDVITGLRRATTAPIVVLSGRLDSADKVRALDAGADDYVTKPFGLEEFLARLRAAVRRSTGRRSGAEEPLVRAASFTVDLTAKKIHRDGTGVHLTPTEWGLLEVLVRAGGEVLSPRRLLAEVWGPNHTSATHYLRVYLVQLRRKLEPDPAHPRHLVTEPGRGYRFQP
ncbi:two-component system KDP operon response regulator KdpE [Saccharothrix carnea]|uniref:Two-component system KDP operon response regulator KdpE n=1 Tax=Saccharothrix carnea TaxID=1280637 RepID=A0A2P8I022_SACCR|nr:response regulator [Saccharothrix carnea]PSL51785.1 two-component system KDP operon response regulator KdpE [Saccharothrix carnea]